MRRATLALALGLTFTVGALPQEPERHSEAAGEAGEHDPWIWWKWANFAILAAGLGYLIAKNVPGLFGRRAAEIQQALLDAANMKKDAEAQAAAMEQRFAGLAGEIERLRVAARTEMTAESERIGRETSLHLQKIQDQSAQEVALMARASREELRRYSATLALDLAGQRLRTRVTADAQNGLVDGFLQDLRRRAKAQ